MTDPRQAAWDGQHSRRKSPRVPGPFLGRRRGALTTEIRIHDLSSGGCLIESFHQVSQGRRLQLEIDLPEHGTVTVEAEALYDRADYGFAVKFVDLPDDTRATLERAIARLTAT
jgi:hypothetical protein